MIADGNSGCLRHGQDAWPPGASAFSCPLRLVEGPVSSPRQGVPPESADAATEFHQLADAARRGDRSAIDALVEPYRNYLLLIANQEIQQALLPKLGASDLVQQTFVTAQEMLPDFRGATPEAWKGWLRQILRHRLNDAERQFLAAKRRSVDRERRLDDSQLGEQPLVDPERTPRSDAIVREEARLVEQEMARLPEHYRRVLQLRNWEELSFPEIGRQLGISAEAARKTWFRAIVRLEDALRPRLNPESRDE
jgi:RNA polymerase sigma-70 factor (ECF subfamily)